MWTGAADAGHLRAARPTPRTGPGRASSRTSSASRSPKLRGRVFILEDYDIRIARFLVQGVDVWLNNPRRPLEASGHVRHEGRRERRAERERARRLVGRGLDGRQRLGHRRPRDQPDEGAQDWSDAQDLYRILEQELIPAYYERDADGLPVRWVQLMRNSIASSDLALLHDADAPRVRRAPVPPGGGRRGDGTGGAASPPGRAPSPRPSGATQRRTHRWPPRISLALAIHNHQPVGNFGWVFDEVYDQAYLPMLGGARAPPGRPPLAPLHGPAARVARGGAAGVPRAPGRARRQRSRSSCWAAACTSRSCVAPRARPRRPADAHGRRDRGHRRPPTARRVARGAGLGARPADVARRGGLPLDDPRRPALPRGGDPRGEPLGRLHDRGPGPPADGLRDRAGPALPDPVRVRRGRHRLPPRPRDRGRQPGRHDGRRRREVRRLADRPTPHCWARRPLGRPLLRRARGEPRLAHDRHAVASGSTASRRSGASTCRRPRTRRWASGPCRPTRRWCSRRSSTRPSRTTVPRRAGCAAASGATSRSSTARSTTCTSRCCGRPPRSPRCPRARAGAAVDHLHRGQSNDCYWHGLFGGIYISHMRLATYEHLIAAEDAADRALGTMTTATMQDLDLDGLTRCCSPTRARSWRSSPARAAGSAAGTSVPPATRSRPRSGAGPRRTTRRSGPTRRRRPPAPRAGATPAATATSRCRSTTSSWSRRRASAARLHYDDHERRSGLVRFLPADTTPEAFATAAETELGDLRRRRASPSTTSRRARSRCRARGRWPASGSR